MTAVSAVTGEAGRGHRTEASTLTCIEQQTAEGADQLQVQAAGLREGIFQAQEQQEGCVA